MEAEKEKTDTIRKVNGERERERERESEAKFITVPHLI